MTFSASSPAVGAAGGRVSAHVRRLVGRPVARVQNRFESFCSQLGFCRVSTIFPALVRQDRLPLSHECKNVVGSLPATWGFVPGAYGKRALVSRGPSRGPAYARDFPQTARSSRLRAVRTGEVVPGGPCALPAAISAHTPSRTGSPVRTVGSYGNDAGLHGS